MRVQLYEARTIKTAQNAIELLNNGKLAGRLGGKKFVPDWLQKDEETFRNLVDATLLTIGDDPNIAGDETIQTMIKLSFSSPDRWLDLLENLPDVLVALSRALSAQWFVKSPDWMSRLNQLLSDETYDREAWHKLEKDIQETFAKRAAKKHKTINDADTLYDTLYEDAHWKLCVPKSFEGDIELASHMEPFGEADEYTKARWCTAAQKNYYDRYTNNGKNKLYVIQYYSAGKYKNAWQLAFCDPEHIEFMDKEDAARYSVIRRQAPKELLDKIICDNSSSLLKGFSLSDIWEITPNSRKIDDVFSYITPYTVIDRFPEKFMQVDDRLWLTKDGTGVVYIDTRDLPEHSVLKFPESVETFLGESLYRNVSKFETVHVPKKIIDTLNDVDRSSFKFFSNSNYANNVKKLVFAEGIETIPSNFAYGMTHLESIILPSTLTKIEERAFTACCNLKYVDLPASLKIISAYAFSLTGLQEINLPEGLVTIDDQAFADCENLRSIDIPDSVTTIGNSAFEDCINLVSAKVPTELTSKGTHIFKGCKELTKVVNMQVLADVDKAFFGCSKLDTGSLESARTRITASEYQDKGNLDEYVVNDNIVTIGKEAFSNSSLKKVVIGANVETIEDCAFSYCANLKVVDLSRATKLKNIASYAFSNTAIETIVIPNSVEVFGEAVFADCRYLKHVKLSDNLKILEAETFKNCNSLEDVTLPVNLRKIRSKCFYGCSNLVSIGIPRRVTVLGKQIFQGCSSLTDVRLPQRISYIPAGCFDSCSSLNTVEFSTNVVEIQSYAFEYCENLTDIKVYGDLEDYDMYTDIDYSDSAFRRCPYREVLEAAGVQFTK